MSVLLALLIYPILALYRGLVLSLLWGWFVVPLGAPPLTIIYAIGISLLAYLLTAHAPKRDEAPELGYWALYNLVLHTFVLAFGFLWSLFR